MVDTRLGIVCLFLSRDECLDTIGGTAHYTRYGCEYLQAIAINITSNIFSGGHYMQALEEYGRSAIIICDVPISLIAEYTFSCIVKESLYDIFTSLLDSRDYNYKRGAGVLYIRNELPPSCVVNHKFLED